MAEILAVGIFAEDKRICLDVEADMHERLRKLTDSHSTTLAKLTRKLYDALLQTEETPNARLVLQIDENETILHQSPQT